MAKKYNLKEIKKKYFPKMVDEEQWKCNPWKGGCGYMNSGYICTHCLKLREDTK